MEAAGTSLPVDVTLDGVSLLSLMSNGEVPASGGSSASQQQQLHECIYFWREHTLYAIRCGQYKAHFITRSGFDFKEPPLVHDPPLLFNVDWDPAEAIGLDTTTKEYAAVVDYLTLQADAHVASVEVGASQYLAQNYSRVPCCPRGDGSSQHLFQPGGVSAGNDHSSSSSIGSNSGRTSLTADLVAAYGASMRADVRAAVDILGIAVADWAGAAGEHEGPWRQCLCQRPEVEVSTTGRTAH